MQYRKKLRYTLGVLMGHKNLILVIGRVGLGNHDRREVLQGKHLQDQQQTVGVQQMLAKVVELHDV
jgi:hypothetical protein